MSRVNPVCILGCGEEFYICRGTQKDCLAWEDDKKSRHSTSYTTHKGRWQGIDGKCFDNTFLQYD